VEKFTPHEDQRKAIDFIKENKAVLLKAPTGAGKTLVGVQTAVEIEAKRVLLIAPLNTESGWRDTVARQYGDTIEYRYAHNKRVAGKRAWEDLHMGKPGFYFVGREFFKTVSWRKVKKLDFIIFDECHAATNRDSKMHKMLKTAKAPYALAMSATPAGNHMQGIWALARWLWPKKTPQGFWNWVTEWFHTEHDPYADTEYGEGKKVTAEREPGALWKALPAAFKMKSVYNEKPIIHTVEVEISAVQRKHYQELEEEAITWLNDNPLAIDIPAVLNMRLRQMCLAVPSVRQDWVRKKDKETGLWMDTWGDVVWFEDDAKSTKIDAIKEILSDIHAEKPEPVLIFTDSRIFATICTKQLQAAGYRARQFVGGMSTEEREWKKKQFGKKFDVMVCTLQTVAEGTDGLQWVACNEIWANVSWSPLINTQGAGRLSRQGQKRQVNRWMLLAKGTVEVVQRGRLRNSQQMLDDGYEDGEAA
jgi:SNF2 family DNA or RNA helicase